MRRDWRPDTHPESLQLRQLNPFEKGQSCIRSGSSSLCGYSKTAIGSGDTGATSSATRSARYSQHLCDYQPNHTQPRRATARPDMSMFTDVDSPSHPRTLCQKTREVISVWTDADPRSVLLIPHHTTASTPSATLLDPTVSTARVRGAFVSGRSRPHRPEAAIHHSSHGPTHCSPVDTLFSICRSAGPSKGSGQKCSGRKEYN